MMLRPEKKFDRKDKKKGKKDGARKKVFKKKVCKFCVEKVETLGYMETPRFQKFLTERGKIVPSRISGNCAKHQRMLARAVKRARVASLIPYIAE